MKCKCGSELFEMSVKCNGWVKQLITGDGEIDDTNMDSVRYSSNPKTVICAECGKRNPNPLFGQ